MPIDPDEAAPPATEAPRSKLVNGGQTDFASGFFLKDGLMRGRFARLGPVVDLILERHDYPQPVGALLAEAMGLATVFSAALKYEGVFTLQVQGDGPVSLVMADLTSGGDLRAYARFDRDRVEAALTGMANAMERDGGKTGPVGLAGVLLGRGQFALSVEQGEGRDRYQGIVDLTGETLADSAQRYFRTSEQIDTVLKQTVWQPTEAHGWQVGVLMLQRMPAAGAGLSADDAEDAWETASVLADSLTAGEMVDRALTDAVVLNRLFHSEGLQVNPSRMIRAGCRCSESRIAEILGRFDRSEIEDMKEDGIITVTCQFCSKGYRFTDADLDRLFGDPAS